MATASAARILHKTLAANTIDTMTLTLDGSVQVEVSNRGAPALLYFRTDGVNPTVGGDDCDEVGPGESLIVSAPGQDDTVVKLISAGANAYSLKAL